MGRGDLGDKQVTHIDDVVERCYFPLHVYLNY